jgi:pyrroloquinoline quinone biosynthesis protein B
MPTQALLLGLAQDAGVPQAGCYCPTCERARSDPTQRQLVVCLGLVDHATKQSWLIDATPDFKEQLHALRQFAPDCELAGIIITHIHMGHYTGLIHLGLEAMNAQHMPVYVTASAAGFLRENAPWSHLVSRENIQLVSLTPSIEIALSHNLQLTPIAVPHRDEFSDTMAFIARGSRQRLFYCPDIDSWAVWAQTPHGHDLRTFVAGLDIALLDASFFSPDELPGRDISQIGHPLVTDTVARLAGVEAEVWLIHLNHSNPLLREGPERRWLAQQGVRVGRFGQSWSLGH